ncbi:MAG: CDGSH iron-sulfur domain-containing protein [Gemmatimonadetes bacterium]|nr:CDGSH iron-sulfur domain-containing protein [Gemmatimonadota bacterium]MBI2402295.1 CDGSH iron-sulfur domain-containing protein [Gemmatimonadota bacterium]MBI2614410.1 CDGSH iron-sulfur domain-containing protein [Gemmatimonadota bacterium]
MTGQPIGTPPAEPVDPTPRIELKPNGPFRVFHVENLVNARGEVLPTKPAYSLCRCGNSKTKPFCDGTHKTVPFDSSRKTDGSKDRRVAYGHGRLTVFDNRGICSHAAHCTDDLPSVFLLRQEPWIDPAGTDEDRIIAQVKRCPSGALSYAMDGVEHRDQERPPQILASENGPLQVTGRIELRVEESAWGQGASREHYALCRCGRSKNKPFCDGSHWDGFEDGQ